MPDACPIIASRRYRPWWRPTLVFWSILLVLHFSIGAYYWLRLLYAFAVVYPSSWDVLKSPATTAFLLFIGSVMSLYTAIRGDRHAKIIFGAVVIATLIAFGYDAYHERYQFDYFQASREYYCPHGYVTWWWYDDYRLNKNFGMVVLTLVAAAIGVLLAYHRYRAHHGHLTGSA